MNQILDGSLHFIFVGYISGLGGGDTSLSLETKDNFFYIKTHFEAFLWLCKVKYRSEKPRMDITRPRRDKSLIENN